MIKPFSSASLFPEMDFRQVLLHLHKCGPCKWVGHVYCYTMFWFILMSIWIFSIKRKTTWCLCVKFRESCAVLVVKIHLLTTQMMIVAWATDSLNHQYSPSVQPFPEAFSDILQFCMDICIHFWLASLLCDRINFGKCNAKNKFVHGFCWYM